MCWCDGIGDDNDGGDDDRGGDGFDDDDSVSVGVMVLV